VTGAVELGFSTLAFSERYNGDGRCVAFQIRPSAKQVMRKASKRDAAQRRAVITRARLIEQAEASGDSSASGVNPLERAALVKRLCKPGVTDDEVDEIVRVVEAYLRGCLCSADWHLWLRRRVELERAAVPPPPHRRSRPWTTSFEASDGES
jgi:hypothetical protein